MLRPPTTELPRVSPPDPATRQRRRRIALTLLGAGFVVGFGGLIALTGFGAFEQDRSEVVTVQRDQAAEQARSASAPALALCRSGSGVAPVLQAAGVCSAAGDALNDPVVSANTAPVAPAELDAIAARVAPLTGAAGPDVAPGDDLVSGVLRRVATDPQSPDLDQAQLRAVVAGAVARADPDPVQVTPATPQGEMFTGLRFARDSAGQCQGVVTLTAADGTTRERTTPVGDGACEPRPVEPDPDPPVTATPDPPVTATPDPSTEPGTDEPVPPTSTAGEPPVTTDSVPTS